MIQGGTDQKKSIHANKDIFLPSIMVHEDSTRRVGYNYEPPLDEPRLKLPAKPTSDGQNKRPKLTPTFDYKAPKKPLSNTLGSATPSKPSYDPSKARSTTNRAVIGNDEEGYSYQPPLDEPRLELPARKKASKNNYNYKAPEGPKLEFPKRPSKPDPTDSYIAPTVVVNEAPPQEVVMEKVPNIYEAPVKSTTQSPVEKPPVYEEPVEIELPPIVIEQNEQPPEIEYSEENPPTTYIVERPPIVVEVEQPPTPTYNEDDYDYDYLQAPPQQDTYNNQKPPEYEDDDYLQDPTYNNQQPPDNEDDYLQPPPQQPTYNNQQPQEVTYKNQQPPDNEDDYLQPPSQQPTYNNQLPPENTYNNQQPPEYEDDDYLQVPNYKNQLPPQDLPQYGSTTQRPPIFVTPSYDNTRPPIIIPPKTPPSYKPQQQKPPRNKPSRPKPTYNIPPATKAPGGFVSTFLPPLDPTTAPTYNISPNTPTSFTDLVEGTNNGRPLTSYKNNAPAPSYSMSTQEQVEEPYNPPPQAPAPAPFQVIIQKNYKNVISFAWKFLIDK